MPIIADIARIARESMEDCRVTEYGRIRGLLTAQPRAIDLNIRWRMLAFDLLAAFRICEMSEPLDADEVERFSSIVQDVGANKAAIIAPGGFTDAASTAANDAGVNLHRGPEDALFRLPVLTRALVLRSFNIKLSGEGMSFVPPQLTPRLYEIFDGEYNSLGTVKEILERRLSAGSLAIGAGLFEGIPLVRGRMNVRAGGVFYPVAVEVDVLIEEWLHFGLPDIRDLSGMQRGEVFPQDIEWKPISNIGKLAVRPLSLFMGSLRANEPDLLFAVPYVSSSAEVVAEMLKLAEVHTDDMVYDLGCGDGRFVITAAREYGARGVGIDSNAERITEARRAAEGAHVADRVTFRREHLFDTDLRDADVVTLYLLPSVNQKLRPKLLRELKAGARVVSNSFDMGDWKPDRMVQLDGRTRIFLWIMPGDDVNVDAPRS